VTTSAGLHAQPAQEGDRLYLGDRKGRVYALTPASGRVELLHTLRSMVLGAVLVDPQRGQLVVGETFGFVTALTPSGRIVWQERVGGAVVGQPL
ncbi:PQQ-binding-like beta-propeller repeat protein, partial [Nocardia puris]|uniref:outer membrane protein assembly factor BamB family protein n=1 Tax=Nocardia puris TaxID=208602 RepID=UPI001893AC9D